MCFTAYHAIAYYSQYREWLTGMFVKYSKVQLKINLAELHGTVLRLTNITTNPHCSLTAFVTFT